MMRLLVASVILIVLSLLAGRALTTPSAPVHEDGALCRPGTHLSATAGGDAP